MTTITITGIESKVAKTGNTKIIFLCKEGKFYFYKDTKTGTSKAWDQYQKFGFKLGDTVEAEVQTEEKEFEKVEDGIKKTIKYMDNWVKFFGETDNVPNQPQTSKPTENIATPQISSQASFEERVQSLEDQMNDLRSTLQL